MKKQRFATWKAPSKMPDWYAEAFRRIVMYEIFKKVCDDLPDYVKAFLFVSA